MPIPDDARKVQTPNGTWYVLPDGEIWRGESVSHKSRTRNGAVQRFKSISAPKPIAPYVGKNGYYTVQYRLNGKRYREGVHRLIALAFVPGFFKNATVNHINGIKSDNRIENLEWITRSENTRHQWRIGLVNLRGDLHPSKKLDAKRVLIIRRLLKMGASCNELATLSGVSQSLVALIRDGARWQHIQ